MPDLRFFEVGSKIDLDQATALTTTGLIAPERKGSGFIEACAPLSFSGDGTGKAAFFSDRRYLDNLKATRAEFVFVTEAFADAVPATSVPLIGPAPQAAWSRLAARLHPQRIHDGAQAIHPSAKLEEGVSLGVGVVIGQDVEIGAGTRIEAYAVIGPGCRVGRNCRIGAHTTVYCALLGDRVVLASGVRIGEPGFGVTGDAMGLVDVPQLGRVILQDSVGVGPGTCIDRGAFDDTIIGEGTRLDNMVHIAHNARIGRNCLLAGQVGFAGTVTVGDGAMFGGQAGVADHIHIGANARIGAGAGVLKDVPDGETVSGYPARPARQFMRETLWVAKQVGTSAKDKTAS